MTTKYVEITREAFEDWLIDFMSRHEAVQQHLKVSGTVGVYDLTLSEGVAIRIASSQGSGGSAMGRAKGAIRARLVSRITGDTLNKKAAGQDHVKRTVNWRKSLWGVCERLLTAYQQNPKFYNLKAEPKRMQEYTRHWLDTILSVRDWATISFLKDVMGKLDQGYVLSDAQEKAILRFTASRPPEGPDWGAYIEESGVPWHTNSFLAKMVSLQNQDRQLTGNQEQAVLRTVHRMKWVNRLRSVWKRVPEAMREEVAAIGQHLTGKDGTQEWKKLDGPTKDQIKTLTKGMPGVFEDLAAGPLPPDKAVQRRASMVQRVVSQYLCSN